MSSYLRLEQWARKLSAEFRAEFPDEDAETIAEMVEAQLDEWCDDLAHEVEQFGAPYGLSVPS